MGWRVDGDSGNLRLGLHVTERHGESKCADQTEEEKMNLSATRVITRRKLEVGHVLEAPRTAGFAGIIFDASP
ncbi:hypothetical protein [Bradyrhizobium zhanjiangense]|uniref:hypothetical protein n=1 Tax=Bradyrhizobium zhanjiangense TaxID=1325107 RepID=UPI0013E8DF5C|nr:hypothetical protein [Bradyrhizobium zhanjiangense]